MTLAAAVAHTLPTLRAEAEAMMREQAAPLDLVRTFDKASMKWIEVLTPGTAVPAKLTRTTATNWRQVGEAEVPIGTPLLCTPITQPRWRVGQAVQVTAGPNAGRRFTVTHVGDPTHAVQHKYALEEVQA